LRWLGAELDPSANDKGADLVNATTSSVEIRVIPTSEETTIARQLFSLAALPGESHS
jgi:acetate kinase